MRKLLIGLIAAVVAVVGLEFDMRSANASPATPGTLETVRAEALARFKAGDVEQVRHHRHRYYRYRYRHRYYRPRRYYRPYYYSPRRYYHRRYYHRRYRPHVGVYFY